MTSSRLQPHSANDVLVSCRITNTGRREGDEVAQLYVREETASVVTPVKALKGFLRIHLKPEESKTVTFHLKQSDLAVWNASQEWQVEPGEYTVTRGRKFSRRFVCQVHLEVKPAANLSGQ